MSARVHFFCLRLATCLNNNTKSLHELLVIKLPLRHELFLSCLQDLLLFACGLVIPVCLDSICWGGFRVVCSDSMCCFVFELVCSDSIRCFLFVLTESSACTDDLSRAGGLVRFSGILGVRMCTKC